MRIYTHSKCINHLVPEGHSERPDRLTHLLAHLEQTGIARELPYFEASPISKERALLVHKSKHMEELDRLVPEQGLVPADPDTWVSPESKIAAELAAGAVLDATNSIIRGEDKRAFCAVRPPGHHAERTGMMGFCLLNSIAISAASALEHESIKRVAILDFDVHHGNGTVDIFQDDPRVRLECGWYVRFEVEVASQQIALQCKQIQAICEEKGSGLWLTGFLHGRTGVCRAITWRANNATTVHAQTRRAARSLQHLGALVRQREEHMDRSNINVLRENDPKVKAT